MWNRQAWLLVIKLRLGRWPLVLTVSLAVLDETVVALTELAGLFNPLIKLPRGLRLIDPLLWTRNLLKALRKYPRWPLAQVESDEMKIKVSLY